MADWTTITDTQVDPDAPLTSGLAYAWRNNPIAIAEGATGAPRVMPLAMQTWIAGVALDDTATPVAVTGIDPNTMVQIMGNFKNGSTDAASLLISASSDGGTTWGDWAALMIGAANTRHSVHIVLNLKNGAYTSLLYDHGVIGTGPFNALRFRHSDKLMGSGRDAARLAVWSIGRAP